MRRHQRNMMPQPSTRSRLRPSCRRAESKSATFSISAPNIPSRCARLSQGRMASNGPCIWVHTASGQRGSSARSLKRFTTTPESNGRKPLRHSRSIILNLKQGDAAVDGACEDIYRKLGNGGVEVLYHDDEERPGAKFATADLIGIPWQILIGPKGLGRRKGRAEMSRRRQSRIADAGSGRRQTDTMIGV